MNLAPEKSGAFFCPKFPAPTSFGALIPVAYLGHQHLVACHIYARPVAHALSYQHTTTNNYSICNIVQKYLDNCFLFACRTSRCYAGVLVGQHNFISYEVSLNPDNCFLFACRTWRKCVNAWQSLILSILFSNIPSIRIL